MSNESAIPDIITNCFNLFSNIINPLQSINKFTDMSEKGIFLFEQFLIIFFVKILPFSIRLLILKRFLEVFTLL